MRALMRELGTPLPQYRRTDAVLVGHLQHPAAAAGRPARRSSSAEAPMDCSEGSDCAAAAAGAATGIKTEEQGQRPGRQPDASSSGANGDCSGANGGSGGGGVPFTIYVRSRHGPKVGLGAACSCEASPLALVQRPALLACSESAASKHHRRARICPALMP